MAAPFVHELRVRYGECDPQGIVFNANYLLYFDVAFTELWRAAVGPWQEMNDHGFDAVVGEATLRFRSPARYDDVVQIGMHVASLGTSSIATVMEIRRDGELLVEAQARHVVIDRDSWQPAPMPDFIRTGLSRFTG